MQFARAGVGGPPMTLGKAIEQGAKVACGGGRPKGLKQSRPPYAWTKTAACRWSTVARHTPDAKSGLEVTHESNFRKRPVRRPRATGRRQLAGQVRPSAKERGCLSRHAS